MEPRNPELEAQIIEHPDDAAPYAVYGDWLESRGDPRGPLVAAHAAGNAEAAAAILAEHRDALVGPALDLDPPPRFDWHLGFWRGVHIGAWGWSAKPAGDDHVAALLAHPSARFVRDLEVRGAATSAVFDAIATTHRTLVALDANVEDGVGNRALAALRECTRLETLNLFSCEGLTDLSPLRALRALRSLDLRNCALDDRGAAVLAELPHLARVMFNAVGRLTPMGMTALARLPLVSLELDGDPIGDDHVATLARHPTLANLELGGAPLTPAGAASLATLPALRRLYLPSSTLGDDGVRALAGLELRSLHLGHCRTLTDAAAASIARMTTLRYLDLASNQIGGAGLRALAPLRELEQLDLAFLELDDEAALALRAFPKLRTLNLGFTGRLTDAVIDVVAGMDQLEVLDLAGSAITARGIDRLSRMPKLASLGLEDCASEAIELARANEAWYVNTRDLLDQWDRLEDYV